MMYDAIIVGSGPGGASAAYEMSRRGLKTLVLEKAKHPWHRTCNGWLSVKIETLLGNSFHHLVERTISSISLSFRGEEWFTAHSDRPVAYIVQRELFDAWLCNRARTVGAVVREDEAVVVAWEAPDAVVVETPKATYCGRVLIGADGAQSVVARSLRMVPSHLVGLAIVGEARVPPVLMASFDGVVEIEIGRVPYRYGWVFPKKAGVSFGVAMLLNPGLGAGKASLVSRRTLLVGDAAGLVDPFLGEGIFCAIRSGQIAADVVTKALADGNADLTCRKDALASYDRRIAWELYGEFKHALTIGRLVSLCPRWCFEFFRHSPEGLEPCFRVLRGEESYSRLWKQIARHIVARRWLAEKPTNGGRLTSYPRPFHPGTNPRRAAAPGATFVQRSDDA